MRILVILGLIALLFYLTKGLFARTSGSRREPKTRERTVPPAPNQELVKDPQCQTYVPISNAVSARIRGREVFFCSQDCMDQYLRGNGR